MLWFLLHPFYIHNEMFTDKPSLNGFFTTEMSELLINRCSQSYLPLQLLYLTTSGKTKFLYEVQIIQM